jgi:hypothetical protein
MSGERQVLGKLVGRYAGTTRGVFELGDGRHVEVEGIISMDAVEAPQPGEKALVVLDEHGRALRWEPYAGAHRRRELD